MTLRCETLSQICLGLVWLMAVRGSFYDFGRDLSMKWQTEDRYDLGQKCFFCYGNFDWRYSLSLQPPSLVQTLSRQPDLTLWHSSRLQASKLTFSWELFHSLYLDFPSLLPLPALLLPQSQVWDLLLHPRLTHAAHISVEGSRQCPNSCCHLTRTLPIRLLQPQT